MNLFNKLNWYIQHQIRNPFSCNFNESRTTVIRPVLVAIFTLISYTILLSCSGERKHTFSYNEEAISEYQNFMSDVNQMKKCSASELADLICQWQELADSVFDYISPSPEYAAHCALASDFFSTTDSIRAAIVRLVALEKRSLLDMLTVKDKTNPYRNDTTLSAIKVEPLAFFTALDKLPTMQTSKEAALSSYRNFLQAKAKTGIHSQEDFMRFLKSEDLLYRQFMAHLSEYGDTPLADVTANTEAICRQIFEAANANELDADETMVYMAVRTNRRVLLNAMICLEDLKSQRIKDPSQVVAYHWMLLQPFVSIDNIGMALLTESQKQMLYTIADEYPVIVGNLGTADDRIERLAKELPNQILTLYISTL